MENTTTNYMKQFNEKFWNYYLLLEDEFLKTERYLSLDKINRTAFSIEYAKILLEIGSEVDVLCKEYCYLLDSTFKKTKGNINIYVSKFCNIKSFLNAVVKINQTHEILSPWALIIQPTAKHKINKNLNYTWWNIYNKVKHNRVEYDTKTGLDFYKLANQDTLLNALAGLYQLEIFYLVEIIKQNNLAKEKDKLEPIIESKLFSIEGMALMFERKKYSQYLVDGVYLNFY